MYSARERPAAPSAAGFGASSTGQVTSSGSELAKDMSMGPFARLERRDSMESISSKGSRSSALTNMTYGFGGASEVARRRRHHVARHELDRAQEYTVVWVADEERASCACCGAKFSIRLRKHHCRACGEVVCSYCSKSKAMVLGLKGAQRVCDTCLNEEVDKAKANGWALPTLEGAIAGRGNARSDTLTPPIEAAQQAVTPPRDQGTQGPLLPMPDVPVSPASAVGAAQGSSEEGKVLEGEEEEGQRRSSPQSTPERPSSRDERAAEQVMAEHEHEQARQRHEEEEERQVNNDAREVVDAAPMPVGPLIAEEEASEGEAPDDRNTNSPQENERGLAAALATGHLQQAHREVVRATDENAREVPMAALSENEDDVARAQGGGAGRAVVSPSVGGEEEWMEGAVERARSEAVSREHEVQEESGGRRGDGVSAGDGEPKQQTDGQQVDGPVRAAGAASGGVAHVESGSAAGGRDEWRVAGTASEERRMAEVNSARERRMVSKKGRSQPTTYLVVAALGTIAVTTVLLMRPRRRLW